MHVYFFFFHRGTFQHQARLARMLARWRKHMFNKTAAVYILCVFKRYGISLDFITIYTSRTKIWWIHTPSAVTMCTVLLISNKLAFFDSRTARFAHWISSVQQRLATIVPGSDLLGTPSAVGYFYNTLFFYTSRQHKNYRVLSTRLIINIPIRPSADP